MRFSVVVVCYNAGEKLTDTVATILDQSNKDYEIVVKDGGSTDGSLEALKGLVAARGMEDHLQLVSEKDSGIYDAMNAALKHVTGEYVIFMNCGDAFYDGQVLEKVSKAIDLAHADQKVPAALEVFYGNRYLDPTKSVEYASPKITPLTCYRNIPCHQCCFYSASCFSERGLEPKFRIRADYEHFLWLYFEKSARFYHVNECIARYEGGGYSESEENVKRSAAEHKEITKKYLSAWQLFYCKAYMVVTLQPLRHFVANNPVLSKGYNKMVRGIYRLLGRK